MEEILKCRDVAKILGISERTLARWRKAGQGPSYKITPGGYYLFRRTDLNTWLEELPDRKEREQG